MQDTKQSELINLMPDRWGKQSPGKTRQSISPENHLQDAVRRTDTIKQHLKIKSFWGTTENAVRIQIYSALIAYCLVAIVGTELKINRSTYEILQVLGISLLDKTPVVELLTVIDYKDVKEQFSNQLSLNLF